MFGKAFKGIAIAVGVGIAAGVVAGKKWRTRSEGRTLPEGTAGFERLNDRLDRVESMLARAEARPSGVRGGPVNDLDLRIQDHSNDIDSLRIEVGRQRRQMEGQLSAIENRLGELASGLSEQCESIIAPHTEALGLRLRAEIHQSVRSSLSTFERAIEDKVADRIALVESAVMDQMPAMTALTQRMREFDANLQRLIAAVERLSPGTGGNAGPRDAAPQPVSGFELHVNPAA